MLPSFINAILLFCASMTIRGRFGLGTSRPVLGFFQSWESASDQLPVLPALDHTANRDRSKGELKQTINSPFRTDFQKIFRMNVLRSLRLSCVSAGKYSICGKVGGSSLYLCRAFASAFVCS